MSIFYILHLLYVYHLIIKERSLNDPTDFTYNELVDIVKELTEKVKKERKEKAKLEKDVREEMTGEYKIMMDEIKVKIHSCN